MSVSDSLTWDETFTNFFHDLSGCCREDEIAWYHRSLLSLHKPKLRSLLDGFSWGEISKREKVEDNYNFTWQANSHFNLSSVPDRSKKIEFEKVSTCPVIEEQTNRWFNTNNTPRPKNGSYCLWRLMKIQVWESYCTTLRLCSQGAQLNCENHQEHVVFVLLDFAFPSSSWE